VLQVDNACVSSHGNLVPFGIFIRFRFSPQFALPFYFLHSRFDVGLWNVTRERVAENRVYIQEQFGYGTCGVHAAEGKRKRRGMKLLLPFVPARRAMT